MPHRNWSKALIAQLVPLFRDDLWSLSQCVSKAIIKDRQQSMRTVLVFRQLLPEFLRYEYILYII